METNTFWQLVTEPWLMQRGTTLDRASEPATRVIVGFDCSVESSWGSESTLTQRPSMLSPSLAGEQRLRAPSVNTRSIPDKRSQTRCSRNSSCNPSPLSPVEPQAEPRQSPSGGRPASDNVTIGAPSRAASSRSEPDEEMAAAVEYAKKLWGSSPAAIIPTGTIPPAASGARFLHSSPTSASGFPASTSPASLDSRGASGSVGAPPQKPLCILTALNSARGGADAAQEELSELRGALQKEQLEVAALQAQVQQLAYEKEELLQQATWYAQQAYYASATAAAPPAPVVRASL